jgi:hypothetical protein
MKALTAGLRILLIASLLGLSPGWTIAADEKPAFSQSELDQMMAPIALYPDALLSQILMASTYPAQVAEAAEWSKANPKQEGDAAVKAVEDKSWDPSVMSLVAFPQVMAMMGEKPDWVQNLGDAFLADPDSIMDTAQALRKKAKDQGNLETTEQQTVTVEEESSETVVVIEPADPKVVYVPVYNPTVIYGPWWWPSYPPYYWHPVGWGFGSAVVRGIGFGIGIGITNALWGNFNWRNRSVDINVNRYNNINVNRRLDVNSRSTSWKHDAANRKGVPYRDKGSREKYGKNIGGADKRKEFRGRDADRAKAQSALKDRGLDPARERKQLTGAGGDRARDSVKQANREVASGKLGNRAGTGGHAEPRSSKRDGGGQVAARSGNRGNSALRDVGNAGKTKRDFNRGSASMRTQRSGGGRAGGGMRAGGGGGHRGR